MADSIEKSEREHRAKRLVQARKAAGFSGPTPVAEALKMNVNSYKAYEQGRNGFGIVDAKAFAALFGVSLRWLAFGEGHPEDVAPTESDLASKYREILTTFDALPPDLQENYAEILRNLAKPFQQKELDQEAPPAKAKSA